MRDKRQYSKTYGISRERFFELKYLCLQYDELRKRERALRRGEVDRPESKSGKWRPSDPTGNEAVSMAMLSVQHKIDAIELSAETVDDILAPFLLEHVCHGKRWDVLRPPCGERQFYELKHRFFVELDRRL